MVNIYELLNRIIVNKRYSLSPNLFIEADRTELSEEERSIFDLLKNIVSLGTKIHNDGIEFHPMFVMADGSRTFSIEDISEDDYLILHSLKLEKMPLILRALIADILWTNKKEFNAAKIAANAYWELFTFWYRDDDNVGTIDIIRRAVCISAQTKQTLLFEKIQGWFVDFLEKKAANNDGFFALRVMELFFGQKNFDVSIFLPVLDDLIDGNSDNIAKVEQAYKLKTECLFKLKRKEDAIKNNNLLADYYLEFAEKIFKKDIQGALRAVNFYQKGIMLYRNNGESDKADAAHKRLVEIQKEIPKIMVPFSVELDIKGVIDNLKANLLLTVQNKFLFIIVDAINENDSDGFGNQISAFINKIADYSRAKIVVSCRNEYYKERFRKYLVEKVNIPVFEFDLKEQHYTSTAINRIIKTYSNHFNYSGNISLAVKSVLSEQLLLLRIFFEVNKDSNADVYSIRKHGKLV